MIEDMFFDEVDLDDGFGDSDDEGAGVWNAAESKESRSLRDEIRTLEDRAASTFCVAEAKDGVARTAVFTLISRFNHACVPNCHHEWNDALGMETVHAIRPIGKGEELSISYLMPAGRVYEQRQQLLSSKFGFTCGCAMCSLPLFALSCGLQ